MDSEAPVEKRRRGRRPKNSSPVTDASKLKRIEMDDDLQELINRNKSSVQLENVRVKLPSSTMEELKINLQSLNAAATTNIDQNAYIAYALELANENLKEILKKHLTNN